MSLKLGSLFDGAGTIPFAAQLCGITPIWSSEIEKFPCAVTAKRFPDMKQLVISYGAMVWRCQMPYMSWKELMKRKSRRRNKNGILQIMRRGNRVGQDE